MKMYTQDELTKLSDEDKKKQKNSIQMEIIMLESEMSKSVREKNELEAQIRKLKYDEERLRVELDVKNKKFQVAFQKIAGSEEEIRRLKKRLNLLK
jgi:chromosome segregation ATPase